MKKGIEYDNIALDVKRGRTNMVYEIKNKEIRVILKDEKIELPKVLRKKIDENFEDIKKSGANVWNGEVLCVAKIDVTDKLVEIICKKSDYAHYLYGERIGLPEEYCCRNLSAGALVETTDNYYVVGELDKNTSYPTVLQVTGGNIDKEDIENNNINIVQTIKREAIEELNINLDNTGNEIAYMYVTKKGEQPGVQIFSKAQINMTAKEMEKYFEDYNEYLRKNNLEVEFEKIHLLKKETAVEQLESLKNPRRNYLLPLIKADSKK